MHPTERIGLFGRSPAIARLLAFIPVLSFAVLLLTYMVNVPWMDDIEAFLTFMVGYLDSATIGQKVEWLLKPNNEHRILTGKLLTLLLYQLTGTVNFRWLILLGFGFLLLTLFVLYRVFRTTKLPLTAFVPACFVLLQPQFYLTTTWAITALQHQVAVGLIVGVMYALAAGSRASFMSAAAIQVLASLSMSNGLFGWVAGSSILLLQRQWTRLGAWVVIGVATIWFYFHDFGSTQGNDSSISFFLQHPHLVFFGFFTFTGGLFDLFQKTPIFWRSVLPTIAGFGLMAALLSLLWQMHKHWLKDSSRPTSPKRIALQQRRYFFTGCYMFLLVNAVVVAFLRPRFGYSVMLISNYMIYPVLLVALLYLNYLSESREASAEKLRYRVRLALGVSILLWGFWYSTCWPKIAMRKQQLLTLAYNQQYNDTGLGPMWGSAFMALVKRTLHESERRGIYRFPPSPYNRYLTKVSAAPLDSAMAIRIQPGDYSNVVTVSLSHQVPSQTCLIAQSAQRTYLFMSETPYQPTHFYLHKPLQAVEGEVIRPMLAPGSYQIGILTPTPSEPIRFSRQVITVP